MSSVQIPPCWCDKTKPSTWESCWRARIAAAANAAQQRTAQTEAR